MDNVVQNINITDIIPGKFEPNLEEQQRIEELASLIKQFGMLDPVLVRPKDEKYEIVMGMDKYKAALLANLTSIPVIIKEVTDEVYTKYQNVDSIQDVSLITQSKETFSKKEENIDVVNLDELSKIKLEYERDDVKMNNGQFNIENNNLGVVNNKPAPTFGGSFFPSLEDEPTNMNMMGGFNTPPAPMQSLPTADFNNNLIDLTDVSLDKDPVKVQTPNPANPVVTSSTPGLPAIDSTNINNFDIPNFGAIPNAAPAPMPSPVQLPKEDIINIENLQNKNQPMPPVNEPVSMDILNADFGAPTPAPMDQTIASTAPGTPALDFNLNQNQPPYGPPLNSMPGGFGMPMPPLPPQSQPMGMVPPVPNFDMNMMPPAQPPYGPAPTPMPAPNLAPPVMDINNGPSKDVKPVVDLLKAIVSNLEAFGYKLKINEENLQNSVNLIIEVEK